VLTPGRLSSAGAHSENLANTERDFAMRKIVGLAFAAVAAMAGLAQRDEKSPANKIAMAYQAFRNCT
jgi:hypothetical protein